MTEIKRTITAVLAALTISAGVCAQTSAPAPSPDLLKDKSSYSKTELFDSWLCFQTARQTKPQLKATRPPDSYKPEELLPIAVCYMGMGNMQKAKSLFETFLAARRTTCVPSALSELCLCSQKILRRLKNTTTKL